MGNPHSKDFPVPFGALIWTSKLKGHNIICERQRARCVAIQYTATLCEFIDVIMSKGLNFACGIYSMDGQIYQVQFVELGVFFQVCITMYKVWCTSSYCIHFGLQC